MSDPHFFVDEPIADHSTLALSPADTFHATRVLRLRSGERVTVADSLGTWAGGRLAGERDGRVLVDVEERRSVERQAPLVHVVLVPPKGDRLAWAVQKLTEVGADVVSFVETERSVRSWTPERFARVFDRMQRVAREASMQSRRAFATTVGYFGDDFDAALSKAAADGVVVTLHETATERLSAVLPHETPAEVAVFVGPEGGFTDEEAGAAASSGARLASLGPTILRTETAAVVGAALVLARYGRLG